MIEQIREHSQLSASAVAELAARSRENRRRLQVCTGPHDFRPVAGEASRVERCSLCTGVVSTRAAGWYRLGVEHGRAEVCP